MKHTALYKQHLAAQAKIIDFAGWALPINYGSQLAEQQAVREDAGMFDVSHMNIVDLLGAGGRQLLRTLLANDVDKLNHPGQALYSCMLNHRGGIIDDLIVYFCAPDKYRLVLNAATKEKDLAWIQQQADPAAVGIQTQPDLAMLAIQGPNAISKTNKILNPAQQDAVSTIKPFEGVEVDEWFFARTGYTGEDGLEIILPATQIAAFWEQLLTAGIKPCGLGARDSLRLEAGLLLYGQDMDATTTPLESGLNWTIAWEPQDRNFIGRAALEMQLAEGCRSKFVGLVLEEKGMLRSGQTVIIPEGGTGVITSATYSPTLETAIALARVPVAAGEQATVSVRGKELAVKIIKPRFVKHGKKI